MPAGTNDATSQIDTCLAGLRQARTAGLGLTQERRSTLIAVGDEQRLELLEPIGAEAMQDAP
jgi:hypothetical protein